MPCMWLFKCENTSIVISCLFQHGACVNVADLWKFTPLHEAAAKGKFEICKLLLKVSALFVKKGFIFYLLFGMSGSDARSQMYICNHCPMYFSMVLTQTKRTGTVTHLWI